MIPGWLRHGGGSRADRLIGPRSRPLRPAVHDVAEYFGTGQFYVVQVLDCKDGKGVRCMVVVMCIIGMRNKDQVRHVVYEYCGKIADYLRDAVTGVWRECE